MSTKKAALVIYGLPYPTLPYPPLVPKKGYPPPPHRLTLVVTSYGHNGEELATSPCTNFGLTRGGSAGPVVLGPGRFKNSHLHYCLVIAFYYLNHGLLIVVFNLYQK
jgi:hypothetical protein